MIVGIGTDLVGVVRFGESLERTPALAERVFTPAERRTRDGAARSVTSLAARFAAKEAAAKALGVPSGCRFTDCEVLQADDGRPSLRVSGRLARAAEARGVTAWHVSLTHDAEMASAFVVAEA
ncbi:holo-ACP synthase [Saccharopolyspora erythraea]|uniref:holo-ACP synthase n=1 Tax=Saccharopolyspora erythraea TaxID=1836 RepID=UPI001BA4E5F0|nr:holo-ACP synthase [Saccharopolyspora erythraea]QUH05132.1 holo-ACP synthase [Saccharopolyspora erythraea]